MARPGRAWSGRAWRACLLTAMVASVAGCVGMPDSGAPAAFSATQATPGQNENVFGLDPLPPQSGASPQEIVSGFLAASAEPANSSIARQFLSAPASAKWDPGWSATVYSQIGQPVQAAAKPSRPTSAKQDQVGVAGDEVATLDGTGQYTEAPSQDGTGRAYQFDLDQVNGQWRITNPPASRMLTTFDFAQFYKPLDLYFLGTQEQTAGPTLVPDPVFVPEGSSPTLVTNLVDALIAGPQASWLKDAAGTELSGASVQGISVDGATAVVNLKGLGNASELQREEISAQLAWTLGGQAVVNSIQSVELEIDGVPYAPSSAPCASGGPSPGPVQKQAVYSCYNPYLSTSPDFYFVEGGQAWSRCGLESEIQQGLVGQMVPVFDRLGGTQTAPGGPSCGSGGFVSHTSTAAPPAQPPKLSQLTLAAMSPDGKYLAGVSGGDVWIVPMATGLVPRQPVSLGPDITALSWDRNDDLWVAQGGAIKLVTGAGQTAGVEFSGGGSGLSSTSYVTSLSVAPDGVRMALVVRSGTGSELDLAAISPGSGSVSTGQLGFGVGDTIGPAVQLAPAVTAPDAVAWYGAGQLLVLDDQSGTNTLWEVPVDGQQATQADLAPTDPLSITADGADGALVAGLADNRLEVSSSVEGPWLPLGVPGQAPAYPG